MCLSLCNYSDYGATFFYNLSIMHFLIYSTILCMHNYFVFLIVLLFCALVLFILFPSQIIFDISHVKTTPPHDYFNKMHIATIVASKCHWSSSTIFYLQFSKIATCVVGFMSLLPWLCYGLLICLQSTMIYNCCCPFTK